MTEELLINVAPSGVATMTLSRPHELNAWTYSLEAAFFEQLDWLRTNPDVRVIVVTGAGRGFCAGMSLSVLDGVTSGHKSSRPTPDQRRFMWELVEYPKPILAAINGPAIGIGLALAIHCDIRFATETAKLGSGFVRRGLVAEHGTSWMLPRIVGLAHSNDLLLSGRTITGLQAHAIGLVQHVTPNADVLSVATEYAEEMAASCSPASWRTIKTQLALDLVGDRREGFERAITLAEGSLGGPDLREAMAAHREGRKPHFAPLVET